MKHVLVVDDDSAIVRLCRIALSTVGYRVTSAADGLQALEAIERDRPDAVVLDLTMPVMDGRETFQAMANAGRRPPVLILSASDSEKARRELGAEASLSKPFDPDELASTIEALCPGCSEAAAD
jgi:two-component system, OmpR family, response regulator MprA